MKKLFKFKYPKIAILIVIIVLSYIFFSDEAIKSIIYNFSNSLGYLGAFIGGVLLAFGFTTPISIGLLLTLNIKNILIASVIGSIGSMIANYIIFKTIKNSFYGEFKELAKTKLFKEIHKESNHFISKKITFYLMYIFSGIIIASPLPDEFGITMLAGLTHIKMHYFLILSFILHFIGILIILLI